MTGQLAGKVAIVTGGAQGLGFAIAAELARSGASVCIADLEVETARNAAARITNESSDAWAEELDVSDGERVEEAFSRIADERGYIDILVNSAGIAQHLARVTRLSDTQWTRPLTVNLTGTFICCRAVGRHMERQAGGCIVNIASVNGQNPAPLAAAYNASKAGVISLTRTLALEMAAYGVRVNAVSPGPVNTAFNEAVMAERAAMAEVEQEEMIERVRGAIPLGRWGRPEDIAQGVAFLCSPAAAWITGEVLRISGGLEGVGAAPPREEPTAGEGA